MGPVPVVLLMRFFIALTKRNGCNSLWTELLREERGGVLYRMCCPEIVLTELLREERGGFFCNLCCCDFAVLRGCFSPSLSLRSQWSAYLTLMVALRCAQKTK